MLTPEQKTMALNRFDNCINNARRDFVGQYYGEGDKHDKSWTEYGYPEVITDWMLYWMYRRHPIARASVDGLVNKVWSTPPEIISGELDDKKTGRDENRDKFETQIDRLAQRVNLWYKLKEVEKRGLAGRYAIGVLLLKDGLQLDQPAGRQKGPNSLKKIIPIWSAQVQNIEYVNNERSERYLEPEYWNINQRNTDGNNHTSDNYVGIIGRVHWTRIVYFFYGTDEDIDQAYALPEAGYNDLLDIVKISGAGAESHWKNSARQLNYKFDKEAAISEIAAGLGVDVEDVADALDDQVNNLNRNFDSSVVTIGGDVTTISTDTPDSKEKWEVSVNNYATSVRQPMKELIGNQTGERASSEDATSMSMNSEAHRNEYTVQFLRRCIQRFIDLGVLDMPTNGDFGVSWASLLDPSPNERMERAKMMMSINKESMGTGVSAPFDVEEVRTEAGFTIEDFEEQEEEGEI